MASREGWPDSLGNDGGGRWKSYFILFLVPCLALEGDCCTTYTYRVRARSIHGAETDWTDLGSQKTLDCANACQADIDHDGDVDGKNLYTFLRNFNQPCIIKPCDGDGDVDDADLKVFAKEFGRDDCPCVE